MTRYAILGAGGMLGRAWVRHLAERGAAYRAFTRSQLDISRPPEVERLRDTDVVVNCAAYTAVDQAESDEQQATLINGHAVGWLAARCHAIGAKLIHYSTDYVFDGAARDPYPTTARRSPINAYGRSKLQGELALEASPVDTLLIRTSWVYAPVGNNFVRTMADLLTTRSELKVVNDQWGRPSSAFELAKKSLALCERRATGVFHLTDGGSCNWHEFACEILRLLRERRGLHHRPLIYPCPSTEFVRPAPRPSYSVLDIAPSEALLGALTPWQKALEDAIEQLPV